MSAPAVFVSSTFVDLRYVRETIAGFIKGIGYEPRLFEKGGVGFDYQKPIDESCYDAVGACDIFVLVIGGRYGAPATDAQYIKGRLQKYNSITRKEYLKARELNMPIFIFVDKDVLAEHKTYSKNRENKTIQYAFVDNILIFDLIDDIYNQKLNNYIHSFSKAEEIITVLKEQWASLFRSQIERRSKVQKPQSIKINSFKLFYYRRQRRKTVQKLAQEVGCDPRLISRLERLKYSKAQFTGYHDKYFPDCDFQIFTRLEACLSCVGNLRAGQHDDFLAHYLEFYHENRGNIARTHKPRHPMLNFETKIVIFDFDGTIANGKDGMTTWESLWFDLGYNVNECAEYHGQYRKNLITHEKWCQITLEKFRTKRLTSSRLTDVAKQFVLVPGFAECVLELRRQGIKLYILSGSIKEIISIALGPLASHFEEIKANEIEFGGDEVISKINGTKYDFMGKADYIRRIVKERSCSPMDVLFIGNAGNDGWVSKSGARTLCVNPTSTDPDNPKQWSHSIRMLSDMREILAFTKSTHSVAL